MSRVPTPCDLVSYKISLSTSTYPTKDYTDYLFGHSNLIDKFDNGTKEGFNFSNKGKFRNYFKKNIILFDVFYETTEYTYITQVPEMSLEVLIGAIGGNLGLFTGCSLLNWMQVL